MPLPAQDTRGAGDLEGDAHVVLLAEGDLRGAQIALLLQAPEVERHDLPLDDLHRHLGELLLDELLGRDRACRTDAVRA
jgi:hypothetical protein